nr:hypothetical protein [uncultured Kingella sp.]
MGGIIKGVGRFRFTEARKLVFRLSCGNECQRQPENACACQNAFQAAPIIQGSLKIHLD